MNSEAKADKATTSSRDEAYAKGAFKSVVDEVAGTSEGGRNSTLNAGAFRLGRFVGAGLLGEDEVKSALQAAAEKAGLGATEARKTIASGLNAGKADPWDASERKDDDQGNGRATNGNGNRNIAATNGKGHTTNGKLVEESRPIDGDDLERRAIARLAESKFSGLLKDAPVLQELALLKGEQPARYATLRTSLREADRGFGIKVFEEAVRAHGPAKTPLDAFLEIGERAADEIDRPNESEDDPYRLARHYRDLRCTHRGKLKTRFHRGEILDWIPSKGAYRILPEKEVRASIGTVTKEEFDRINLEEITRWKIRGKRDANGEPCPKPVVRKVTEPLRTNVYGNLASLTVLPIADVPDQPAWLDPSYDWPPEEVLPTPTALIHVPSLVGGIDPATIPPTPDFFSTFALNYDFDPEAPEPVNWLTFLGAKPIGTDCEVKYQLWRGPDSDEVDWESIETLQEWMGLQLLPDSSHQKIMMLIGPKRSGKGTIARVLRRLVGEENVSGPTLSSLGGPFGTEPLIGKHTAIISDARISGRSDIAVIVERLLTTSGEDAVTVPRKHKPAWEGKLPTRLTILSNELPKITDSSGALAGRMILLPLTRSFYNVEDRGLTNRLMGEMPGILLWAIKGWERLRARGYFIQPESGKEQIDQLEDLVSPIGAYLKDRCDIGPGKRTPVKELHEDWKDWCQEKGRKEPGEESTFGRNLRAALPHLKTTQVRQGEGRIRVFEGIAIRNPKPDVDWSLPENSSRSAT